MACPVGSLVGDSFGVVKADWVHFDGDSLFFFKVHRIKILRLHFFLGNSVC